MKNLILKAELFKNKSNRKKSLFKCDKPKIVALIDFCEYFYFIPSKLTLKKIQNPLYSQETKRQLNMQRFARQELIFERLSNN